jgi:hypothetical protein
MLTCTLQIRVGVEQYDHCHPCQYFALGRAGDLASTQTHIYQRRRRGPEKPTRRRCLWGGSGRPWYRFRARTSGGVRAEVAVPATLVSIHLLGVVCNTIRRGVDTVIGGEGEYRTTKAGVCSRFASASMSVHVKRVSSLRCHACRFQFFISSGMSDRGTANSTFNALVQLDP